MVATSEHDTKIDDCLVPTGCSLGFCLLTLRNQLNQAVNFSNDMILVVLQRHCKLLIRDKKHGLTP